MNLGKLIRTPGIGVTDVREALTPHFADVFVEERGEPFFTHHIRCIDREGLTRLWVRFGWSASRIGWVFETLAEKKRLC